MTKKNSRKSQTESGELKDELGAAIALKVLHDSEGGQILIEGLVQDIIGAMDAMIIGADTLSHIAFVMLASRMKERVDLLRTMTGAESRKDVLDDLVKEALKREEGAENDGPRLP